VTRRVLTSLVGVWVLSGAAAAASSDPSKPGADLIRTITVGDGPRVYHLHIPPGRGRRPLPLVINLHGLGSNALEQEHLTGMAAVADREGFCVLSPEGVGAGQSFNAGMCCGEALRRGVDDVAYIRAALVDAAKVVPVDAKRVYATGMSNGGFMAHRLACELSDRIAAVAPVAGLLGLSECHLTHPVSVLQFHGTADSLVQYGGGGLATFPSVDAVLGAWAERDGCKSKRAEFQKVGDVTCERYADCPRGVDVELCRVEGGGHTWPGGLAVSRLGRTTTAISATETMWRFFREHPMSSRDRTAAH
jgi:polyhydroxybutyrate depolymerase